MIRWKLISSSCSRHWSAKRISTKSAALRAEAGDPNYPKSTVQLSREGKRPRNAAPFS